MNERIKVLVERLKQRFDPAEADELRVLQEAEAAQEQAQHDETEAAAKAEVKDAAVPSVPERHGFSRGPGRGRESEPQAP